MESATDAGRNVETEAITTVAGGWQTLSFDFSKPVAGGSALDPTLTYDKVSIFFDFGTAGTGKTYFFDDLRTAA